MTSTRIRLLQAGAIILIGGFALSGCTAGEEIVPEGPTVIPSTTTPSPTPAAADSKATAESAAATVNEFMELATSYPTADDLAVLGLPEDADIDTTNEAFISMGELSAEDLAEKMESVYATHSIGKLLYFEEDSSKVQNQYQAIYMLEMARISTAEIDEEPFALTAIEPSSIEISSSDGKTIASVKLGEGTEPEPVLVFVDGSWKLIGSELIQASAE